jgi:S-adenosylmethionine hydrolase
MSIITLTTDMGLKDHYVATVKGAIWTQYPEARIVDVSAIRSSPSTMAKPHSSCVKPIPEFPRHHPHHRSEPGRGWHKHPHLVVRHDGHWFIGADNGIFSLLFDGMPQTLHAFEVTMKLNQDHVAFPKAQRVREGAACHLARGGTMEVIGRKVVNLRAALLGFNPAMDPREPFAVWYCYIDTYGNVVTNVRKRPVR